MIETGAGSALLSSAGSTSSQNPGKHAGADDARAGSLGARLQPRVHLGIELDPGMDEAGVYEVDTGIGAQFHRPVQDFAFQAGVGQDVEVAGADRALEVGGRRDPGGSTPGECADVLAGLLVEEDDGGGQRVRARLDGADELGGGASGSVESDPA